MAWRDLGVSGDYVDRAFRATDSHRGWTSKGATVDRAAKAKALRVASSQLARMQAKRPLKPPGR